MLFAGPAVERAMKVQEVILRALSGALTWIQAAEILGIHTRSLRRWRARYEAGGVLGLYDGRRGRPSRRKAPIAEGQPLLRLYRDRYGPRDGPPGFNVRHFHHLARRDHGVTLFYSFVKLALQEAGLVRKGRGARPPPRPPRPPPLLRRAAAPGRQPPRLARPAAHGAADPHCRPGRRHQAAALRPPRPGRGHPPRPC